MFISSLVVIYFILIALCLIFSFINRKNDQSHLYFYFLIVGLIELFAYFFKMQNNYIYMISSFLYIGYFIFYFSKNCQNNRSLVYILGGLASVCSLVFILASNEVFPISLGVTIAVLYILLALIWFFSQIKETDTVFIIRKQAFWVSTAMLFWSVVFLFRISLMYWLAENDHAFLILLDKIFKVAVIITYVFYLVAASRKMNMA